MQKYDEQALRRPTFEPGHAVELGDGQKWTMPPIRMRAFPRMRPDGTLEVPFRPMVGGELEALLDILFGVEKEPGYADMIECEIRIAAGLLVRNYDLPPEAVAELLTYIIGDDASEARWDRIRAVILGRDPDAGSDKKEDDGLDPKEPTPDGSSSPSNATA